MALLVNNLQHGLGVHSNVIVITLELFFIIRTRWRTRELDRKDLERGFERPSNQGQ